MENYSQEKTFIFMRVVQLLMLSFMSYISDKFGVFLLCSEATQSNPVLLLNLACYLQKLDSALGYFHTFQPFLKLIL